MNKVFRLVALLLLVAILACSAVSCAADPVDTMYEESGLKFLIPSVMRRGVSEVYDIYFSTLTYAFGAFEIDKEFLESEDLPVDMTTGEYVDFYFEINDISKEDCKVTRDEERDAYLFSYSISSDGELYVYHNCIVLGGAESIWYVEFYCDYNDASSLEKTFDVYLKYVETT